MMRKKCAAGIIGIFLMLLNLKTIAQDARTSAIEPYRLAITFAKTTNLIFPYAIKSIDKGSRDILVQKAIGVENVLQLKAAKQAFPETNLTVVTADGSLYSYVLNYSEQPIGINIKVQNAQVAPDPLAVFTPEGTTDLIRGNSEKVAEKRKSVRGIRESAYGTEIELRGVFVQEGVIYFQFDLRNLSGLNYDVKTLRFYIKDKKKSRRTASQEIDIKPLFVLGNVKIIRSNSEQIVVVAVPKFTIPNRQVFKVQLQEENGGRNLELSIRNKNLFRADKIQ